jgi:hypothetical protein
MEWRMDRQKAAGMEWNGNGKNVHSKPALVSLAATQLADFVDADRAQHLHRRVPGDRASNVAIFALKKV